MCRRERVAGLRRRKDHRAGGQLRCERDSEGNCVKVNLCTKDYRTSRTDDCLAPVEERAWSSPIYVNYAGNQAAPAR